MRRRPPALDPFSERGHRIAMLAMHALGRSQEALGRYRSFRTQLDEELGLEPAAPTRALESAIIRQEDVRSLLPRPIRRAPTSAHPAGAPSLLGRTAELDELVRAVGDGLGRPPHADPGRGGHRAREDAHARRAASGAERRPRRTRRGARSSSATCPTCRSRPHCGPRSPTSTLDADRLPAIVPDPAGAHARLAHPSIRGRRRARGARRGLHEHGPIVLLHRRLAPRRRANAGGAQLPAAPGCRRSPWRSSPLRRPSRRFSGLGRSPV